MSDHFPNLKEIERDAILEALKRHDGHRVRCAAELGITSRTLYSRLAAYQAEGHSVLPSPCQRRKLLRDNSKIDATP